MASPNRAEAAIAEWMLWTPGLDAPVPDLRRSIMKVVEQMKADGLLTERALEVDGRFQ